MSLPSHYISKINASFFLDSSGSVCQRIGGPMTPLVDPNNTTTTPLTSSNTAYVGSWSIRSAPDLIMSIAADQDCTYTAQFSTDGSNIDSSISFKYQVGVSEQPKDLTIARNYYRVRVDKTGSGDMTYLRLQTSIGFFKDLSTPLNANIGADNNAQVVRNISLEDEVGLNRYYGVSLVNKFGENESTVSDTDIIYSGGTYKGFPVTDNNDTIMVSLSSAADIGSTLKLKILAHKTSTDFVDSIVSLTTTLIDTGVVAYRCTRAIFNSGTTSLINQGNISVFLKNTSNNTFMVVPTGTGQSRIAVDTIPANSTALLKKVSVRINKTNNGNLTGGIWIRRFDQSPVIIRPFVVTNNYDYDDQIYGGLKIEGPADISIRALTASTNLDTYANFDYLLYKDQ